jgi:hypothetical protein
MIASDVDSSLLPDTSSDTDRKIARLPDGARRYLWSRNTDQLSMYLFDYDDILCDGTYDINSVDYDDYMSVVNWFIPRAVRRDIQSSPNPEEAHKKYVADLIDRVRHDLINEPEHVKHYFWKRLGQIDEESDED